MTEVQAPWTYIPASPTPENPPPDYPLTREEWEQLTPGYRREIWRSWEKEQ